MKAEEAKQETDPGKREAAEKEAGKEKDAKANELATKQADEQEEKTKETDTKRMMKEEKLNEEQQELDEEKKAAEARDDEEKVKEIEGKSTKITELKQKAEAKTKEAERKVKEMLQKRDMAELQYKEERKEKVTYNCNVASGWRPMCFGTNYKHEYVYIFDLLRPWEDWPVHLQNFIYYLFLAFGYDLDEFAKDPEAMLAKLHKDFGLDTKYLLGKAKVNPLQRTAMEQHAVSGGGGHEVDPPGCICKNTWELIFKRFELNIAPDFQGLNAPQHCDHVLNTAVALQHLLHRFDTAGKIDGKYCKYTKNRVMKFQRKYNLSADGRCKLVDWKEIIMIYLDPDSEDTGGVVTAIVGNPPVPEI